ncbi:alpha-galactosidase [Paenibacillus rhizosphaerae]|uniref:Alpha-galactosidase n=1 Tax=Paenibacillus rhizosphaerae TaxID=297318 RepID=A0A839TNF7_9BACL|nr:alpha-galactosidase [Paenibacillus rhizosphaerae]MBB3128434.1 alpha-galactosidase [Paenibacillus rhizosphaerae]
MVHYQLLQRIRDKYPEVYQANCSSGGLRIDLGLAQHTHDSFLSDPDITRHHLQLFWGASLMLHPSACFHFTWSQNIVHYESNVDKDPIKPDMPRYKLD